MRVLNGVGQELRRRRRASRDDTVVAPRARRCSSARTPCAGRAISADSHVVSGVWTFGVRVPAPRSTEAYGAGGPTTTEHVVRWLWFLGLALAIGALGFRLDLPARARRAARARAAASLSPRASACVVSLQAGIAAFSLRSEDALQLPFGQFLYGDLSPMAATRFGQAFVVDDARLRARARARLPRVAARPGRAARAGVRARARSSPPGSRCRATTRVDAGSSWKTRGRRLGAHRGGVALDRRARDDGRCSLWPARRELRRVARSRASRGSRRCWSRSCSARGPTCASCACRTCTTCGRASYGQRAAREARPRLVRARVGRVPPLRRPAGARARRRAASSPRIGRSLVGESLVGVAVLLAAAVLVDSKPPPQPVGHPDRSTLERGAAAAQGP